MIDYYHFTSFKQKTRRRCVVEKKMMFALIARRHGATLPQITDFFGWVSHATAINAVEKMGSFVEIYPKFRQQLADIERQYSVYMQMKALAACSD